MTSNSKMISKILKHKFVKESFEPIGILRQEQNIIGFIKNQLFTAQGVTPIKTTT